MAAVTAIGWILSIACLPTASTWAADPNPSAAASSPGHDLAVVDRWHVPALTSLGSPEPIDPNGGDVRLGHTIASRSNFEVPGLGDGEAWRAYLRLWEQFSHRPQTASVRDFLRLSHRTEDANVSPSWRAAGPINDAVVRSLRLTNTPVQRFETDRLIVDTVGDERTARTVAMDLERVFWVWTQLFFPFWNQSGAVAEQLSFSADGGLRLRHDARLPERPRLRVVLFADQDQYRTAIRASVPAELAAGVSQSSGFYDDRRRISFFYLGEGAEVVRARRHEWTHQLMDRAASRRRRDVKRSEDFWIVEGVASYMESLAFPEELHPHAKPRIDHSAVLGGWDTSRLAYRRVRGSTAAESMDLSNVRGTSGEILSSGRDLGAWYGDATAWTHAAMHASVSTRQWLYATLADVYGMRVAAVETKGRPPTPAQVAKLLRVDDDVLQRLPSPRNMTDLSIRETEVTDRGLDAQPVQMGLGLLDVTGRPIHSSAIDRLLGANPIIRQLWVERSEVDDGLATPLSRCKHLRELDASVCRVGDGVVSALNGKPLETIYLTGSLATDDCVEDLLRISTLEVLDIQRTGIGPEAVNRIGSERRDIELNPLRIVTP